MIIYFAGSPGGTANQYFESKQPNAARLLSYYSDKKVIIDRYNKKLPTFIDSGAYSAHTKGVELSVDDYIDFVNRYDEHITVFAQMDKIPGRWGFPKTPEQLAEAPEETWKNYLYMRERVKSVDKLMPIFHQGEDFKHLERMVNFTPKLDYLGISSNKELAIVHAINWFKVVFKIIKNSPNPNVKTHAYGMTSFNVIPMFPFYSSDSTSWARVAGMGNILTDFGAIAVSERSVVFNDIGYKSEKPVGNVCSYSAAEVEALTKHVSQYGYDLEQLKVDFNVRYQWNIDYIMRWQNQHNHVEKSVIQSELF